MQVGELAAATGCTPRMIRHYDRQGLLTGHRLTNGYRAFDEHAVEQVRRIRVLLDAGLDLEQIRPLMGCFAPDGTVTACEALQHRVRQQLAALEERRQQLDDARGTLEALLTAR